MTKAIVKKTITILFIVCLACCVFFVYNTTDKDTVIAEATGETTTSGYTFVDDSADAKTGSTWRLTENGTLYTTTKKFDYSFASQFSSYKAKVKNIVFTGSEITIEEEVSDYFTKVEGIYIDCDYTKVYGDAFASCKSLTTMYIRHLDYIGEASSGTFYNSPLQTLTIDGFADDFSFKSSNFASAGDKTNGFTLNISAENITFGAESFDSSRLKSLTVNAKKIVVSSFAFQSSTKLESISLNSNYTSLSYGAFTQCTALKSVYIKHLDSMANADHYTDGHFYKCPLETVKIDYYGTNSEVNCLENEGNSFTFGQNAFAYAGNTTNGFDLSVFGKNITFEYDSFENSYLKNLTVNATNITMKGNAFNSSKILESVTLNSDASYFYYGIFTDCKSLKNVYIKCRFVKHMRQN